MTTDSTAEFNPAVSPVGGELAVHSLRDGHRVVLVYPMAGGPPVQVSTSTGDNRMPDWAPDGRALAWGDLFATDSAISIARKQADGSWAPPIRFPLAPAGHPRWLRGGTTVSFIDRVGVHVLDLVTGNRRQVLGWPNQPPNNYHAWSEDERTLYGAEVDPTGRLRIFSAAIPGGVPRTIVYADNPIRQGHRYGLAVRDGVLYLPLVEPRSDVWVAEVGSARPGSR